MIPRWKRAVAAVLLGVMPAALLSGCWDSHELDSMFIVTGVALDKSESSGQIDIAIQIGETKRESSGSGEASSSQNTSILLNTTNNTVLGGSVKLDRDASHKLLLHHNQALLFGTALAEQGIQKHIDLFLRVQQARLEVPVVIVDGRAEEALLAKLAQDSISGIFLSKVFENMSKNSVEYRVRLIDLITRLLDETTAPLVPIVRVSEKGDKQEIKVTGMAVFKSDKMIGRLSEDEVTGYIWSMGKVRQSNMEVGDKYGHVVFDMPSLDCKREVLLQQDGGVRVALSVNMEIRIAELQGFDGVELKELIPRLTVLAQDEVRRKIEDSFKAARKLNADIYGYGTSVYRKYPKEWRLMKGRWDEVFQDIDFDVRVKAHILGIGQIIQSLEMEENMNENR